MLNDELTIKRLAKKYNFKRCEKFGYELYIESKCDSWVARENSNVIELWHRNKYDTKMRLHKQRDYYDIPYMFRSIYNHDKFKMKKQYIKPCRMSILFDKISVK